MLFLVNGALFNSGKGNLPCKLSKKSEKKCPTCKGKEPKVRDIIARQQLDFLCSMFYQNNENNFMIIFLEGVVGCLEKHPDQEEEEAIKETARYLAYLGNLKPSCEDAKQNILCKDTTESLHLQKLYKEYWKKKSD